MISRRKGDDFIKSHLRTHTMRAAQCNYLRFRPQRKQVRRTCITTENCKKVQRRRMIFLRDYIFFIKAKNGINIFIWKFEIYATLGFWYRNILVWRNFMCVWRFLYKSWGCNQIWLCTERKNIVRGNDPVLIERFVPDFYIRRRARTNLFNQLLARRCALWNWII